MDILIKNMVLPTEDEQVNITILSDGSVIEHFRNESGKWSSYRSGGVTAIELPEHGDLIERSPLVQKIKDEWQKIHEETGYDVKGIFWNKLVEIIESSEVVLEAST